MGGRLKHWIDLYTGKYGKSQRDFFFLMIPCNITENIINISFMLLI